MPISTVPITKKFIETIAFDLRYAQRTPLAAEHIAALRKIGAEKIDAAGDMVAHAGETMDRFVFIEDGDIEVVDPRT